MFNISESQRKVLSIWALIAVIIFALVILLAVTLKREKEDAIDEITAASSNKIIDRNRYYTVRGAITKYYSYLNMKDVSAILKILNKDYVEDNDLTKDNVFDELLDTDKQLSYTTGIMCLKSIDKGVYTYVTEGSEIGINTGAVIGDKYYQITLDGNTSLFNLFPIDEDIYKEVCNEKN